MQILGDGDTEPWATIAEKLGVKSKVKFCGVLPGGEPVLRWLDQIDIYIQPSYQEGLPRAVIEAMSRGCPVVGSRAGGIPELIDVNCIHRTGDYMALASNIEKIVSNKQYYLKLVRQNLEKAEQYKKSILDQERSQFWSEFAVKCREVKNT